MKTFKDEALEIIESLLDTISWLGGDPYEVECAENMTKEAYDFIKKHKPTPVVIEKDRTDCMNGLYCLHSDWSRKIEASNKRRAAKLFGVGVGAVKCIIIPGTKLKTA